MRSTMDVYTNIYLLNWEVLLRKGITIVAQMRFVDVSGLSFKQTLISIKRARNFNKASTSLNELGEESGYQIIGLIDHFAEG